MDRPDLVVEGTVYKFVFKDILIRVVVDRIREKSGDTTGEVTVTSDMPGNSGHFHFARLNLLSTTTRASFARELKGREADIAWPQVLEFVCAMTLNRHRQGEPTIHVADMEAPVDKTFRLDPFYEDGQPAVLFGEGEMGKSYLAILQALLVVTGTKSCGMTPNQGGVWFLDYESDEETFWRRIDKLTSGLDIPTPEGLYYRKMLHPLTDDYEHLKKEVIAKNIQFLVIDSAALAVGGDTMDPGPTTSYFTALRSLGTASVTLAHVPKEDKGDRPYGSIMWHNAPRAVFRAIAADKQEGQLEWDMNVRNTKNNNNMRVSDKAFHFDFRERMLKVSNSSPMMVPDSQSLKSKIYSSLQQGAKSPLEMTGEAAMPDFNAIQHELALGITSGAFILVDHDGTRKYGLPAR